MSAYHLPGEPPVPLVLRRSARAKRISLRISALDGRVTLTLPARLPAREALEFAAEKESWIRDHLARHPALVEVAIGSRVSIEGQQRLVVAGQKRGVRLTPNEVMVGGNSPARSLERYLKELARDRLAAASDHYAAQVGRSYAKLSLRDTRSRWGSCSSAGTLMYSWRLILAPPEVLSYVAAHEVAHLVEMNHSADFWAVVAQLCGDSSAARQWLREEGSSLHRYRFDT
ncbi:SprT family zinc-dependent metalloprotease [Pseudophaeobacter sp.]|uniref:M48 family metallopeptidase n=1 Tax=Pseudophaeobacter sp. TaxID=1971739 RepID=UPI0032977DAB